LTVSLCVVAYNEEKFLPNLLKDLLAQTYPQQLTEIILVDGNSTDKTKEIMCEFAQSSSDYMNISVLDNPKRIQAAGWNIAIKSANGDVIVRLDAHTHIPSEFTSLVMKNIESGENVVGGVRPCLIEKDTAWYRVLLMTENSLFGSSINKCRRGTKKTYVKTVFHAAYRREVFAKAGGFNENLLRTEDNEIHSRIRKAGYRICFDPQIKSYQYARSSLKRMIKQKYGNGYWVGITIGVNPECISTYHLVPLLFLCGIIVTSLAAMFGLWQALAMLLGLYALFTMYGTVITAIREKFNPYVFIMPFLFAVLHISYGIGTAVGLIQLPFIYKKIQCCPMIEEVKTIVNSKINNYQQIQEGNHNENNIYQPSI
jgi:glycosyltransferase involved in cell wall biosynthesis